jgi:hypothetical protein
MKMDPKHYQPLQTVQTDLRICLAKKDQHKPLSINTNGDLVTIPNYRGNFSKSLIHGADNIVNPPDYDNLLKAIAKADPKYLQRVQLGNPNGIKLVDVNTLYQLEILTKYKAAYDIPASPSITSAEAASELIELYAMALARDIPFIDYSTNPQIAQLVTYLNQLPDFRGPKADGQVTVATLFRSRTVGDLVGPFVSQFLLLPFKYGIGSMTQQYPCFIPGKNYLTNINNFLAAQNGTIYESVAPTDPTLHYIYTLRAGSTYVHADQVFQEYFNAAMILQGLGCPFFSGSPFVDGRITNQSPFVSFGYTDLFDLLMRTAKLSLEAGWFVKWTQLKLRPEEFAYQVQLTKTGHNPLPIDLESLDNPILQEIYMSQGNYLLPQVYPEGCPAHPSYPAGHAVLGGALSTILKAFFNCNFIIPQSYVASADGHGLIPIVDQLTVGGELDKLASNCIIFRNAAGIHYRSDMESGLSLGETVAIQVLKEMVWRYTEKVTFHFNLRDGRPITISN